MLVYIYDIKANIRNYNRIKRVFYYNLNKQGLSKYYWKTKSVLAVPDNMRAAVDRFFKEYSKTCVAYKIKCKGIEKIE